MLYLNHLKDPLQRFLAEKFPAEQELKVLAPSSNSSTDIRQVAAEKHIKESSRLSVPFNPETVNLFVIVEPPIFKPNSPSNQFNPSLSSLPRSRASIDYVVVL